MEFRTIVKPLSLQGSISHRSHILTLGSCFADEVSSLMRLDGIDVCANPLGTLYNPESIAISIERMLDRDFFSDRDIDSRTVNGRKIYSCFGTSSITDSGSAEECLGRSNAALSGGAAALDKADVLIITFGTARFYSLEDNTVVANCHKFPAGRFELRRLTIEQIAGRYNRLITRLREARPGLRIIFTISPYRYKKYTLHGSQIDKSILLLATEELCRSEDTIYFPAYEAVLDDLRDYRFYDEDMLHPSRQAAGYVYSLFKQSFYDGETMKIADRCAALSRFRMHTPQKSLADAYLKEFGDMADNLLGEYPELEEFIRFSHQQIKKSQCLS